MQVVDALHGGEGTLAGIFLPSDFGDVLANLATTSRTTDKWMLQLDSAGQKGPEITLEGILIVVEGCFTADRRTCGSGLTKTHLAHWVLWVSIAALYTVGVVIDQGWSRYCDKQEQSI